MRIYSWSFLLLFLSCVFFLQCKTLGKEAVRAEKSERVYLSLLDRLRVEPQITISGGESNPSIVIRGNTSLTGNNEPLFILNTTQVGYGYSSIGSSIDVNNVESIRVLTRSEAGIYGARGGNGVIIIKTK